MKTVVTKESYVDGSKSCQSDHDGSVDVGTHWSHFHVPNSGTILEIERCGCKISKERNLFCVNPSNKISFKNF